MHSTLENDALLCDPYEVLCCVGTLIIEGRTPKTFGDSLNTSEPGAVIAKNVKPYTEGPHCPNQMKTYIQDSHKCTENNVLCLRYNNLKQHMQYFRCVSSTIVIEVSLGPDCLCGELRSKSAFISTQPSKRDVILEQWTITLEPKQSQDPPSLMPVLNVYQVIRSLLHFSQLTAWYMNTNGALPANVIYTVILPENSTFVADEDFIKHDLPVADVNKTATLKISLKTLTRKEKIPIVLCPQHSSLLGDAPSGSNHEDSSKEKNFFNSKSLHSDLSSAATTEILNNSLPLKFQGVRKKTNEIQERKRKKHINLYESPSSMVLDKSDESEVLDGIPMEVKNADSKEESEVLIGKRMFPEKLQSYLEKTSKTEYKKSKSSNFGPDISKFVKPHGSIDTFTCSYFEQEVLEPPLEEILSLSNFSDSKKKTDFRTKGKSKGSNSSGCSSSSSSSSCSKMEPGLDTLKKPEGKTVMDILDDRMQISCAISGKHHCKWECEDENDLSNAEMSVEKPKRRRSLSRAWIVNILEELKLGGSDSEKILHGKFKEVDSCKSHLCSLPQESDAEKSEGRASEASSSDGCPSLRLESPQPNTSLDVSVASTAESINALQSPKNECLPQNNCNLKLKREIEDYSSDIYTSGGRSSESSRTEEGKVPEGPSWVRKESFESFKRGCAMTSNNCPEEVSDSEDELSDGSETANPFLAAILRTTKKSRTSSGTPGTQVQKKCDKSAKSNIFNGESKMKLEKELCKIRNLVRVENKSEGEVKSRHSNSKSGRCSKLKLTNSGTAACCGSKKCHLVTEQKGNKPAAVKGPSELYGENSGSSEFLSKNLTRLKSLFDKQEETADNSKEDSYSSSSNNTKTIPVPSAHDKLKFRRSLDTAAQLVFHRCSGLPLTSSPAPVRRHNNCFSFDSSLNSVSAIKSALFEPSNSLSSEDENESEGSLKSPASPGAWSLGSKQINYHSLSPLPLLGSFEESVLNGRLEPVSTVHGFTAELGASGSFCPRHLCLPVTAFFYTLGDNDKVSAPYLGHINLGKKGYNVPRSGTIQVTLFNPLRTVVKMFVVVYDLSDMPVNSYTFLRQRTLYVPASQKETTFTDQKDTAFEHEDYHKYLRYLIHLRFVSGKTGRIYLHTDIRMVIFRKTDEDTATAFGKQIEGETYELRSHTHGPVNPNFSPRK